MDAGMLDATVDNPAVLRSEIGCCDAAELFRHSTLGVWAFF